MTPKSGAQKSASSRTAPPKAGDKPPSWPKLQPLVPSSDLSLFTLVPDQILLIHNFWTSTLCSTLVKFASSNVELQTTPSQRKRGDALRINDRYQVKDQSLANRLWENTALRELVLGVGGEEDRRKLWGGEPVGVNPNIRVYRYRKGQFFGPHYDAPNTVTLPSAGAAVTTWTILIYLTSPASGCVGGETVFYPGEGVASTTKPVTPAGDEAAPIVVGLETGMALLHRHGSQCMLHEGREVLDGEKFIDVTPYPGHPVPSQPTNEKDDPEEMSLSRLPPPKKSKRDLLTDDEGEEGE